MATARKASVEMLYNDKSAAQMSEYLSSFKYTDVASGSSDSISVQLTDRDRKWINGWFPKKGDKLKPTLVFSDWDSDGDTRSLSCGAFVIDDFSFKGGPIKCSIEAVALPSTSGFKATERTNTYEKTTLKEIGEKVASRAGLKLFYDADEVGIETVAQDKQTDCTFYNDLIVKFGLALKIYNDRLVVFDEATYEAKDVAATLSEGDFDPNSWKYNTTLAGTYTGIKYQYTHSGKNKTFTVEIGGGDRILTCDDAANNLAEATRIAVAKLNNANKGTTTMQITIKGTTRIVATSCVQIAGLGNLNGKYYVEKAVTSVSESGGTKTTLSLRKVEKRFVKAPPAEEEEPVRQSSSTQETKKQQQKTKTQSHVDRLAAKASTQRKKRIVEGTATLYLRKPGDESSTLKASTHFSDSGALHGGHGGKFSTTTVIGGSKTHLSSSGASHGGSSGKIPESTAAKTTTKTTTSNNVATKLQQAVSAAKKKVDQAKATGGASTTKEKTKSSSHTSSSGASHGGHGGGF